MSRAKWCSFEAAAAYDADMGYLDEHMETAIAGVPHALELVVKDGKPWSVLLPVRSWDDALDLAMRLRDPVLARVAAGSTPARALVGVETWSRDTEPAEASDEPRWAVRVTLRPKA